MRPVPGTLSCDQGGIGDDKPDVIGRADSSSQSYGLHREGSGPTTSPCRAPLRARRSPWRVPAPQPPPCPAGETPELRVPHGSSSAQPPASWASRALEEEEGHPAARTSWQPASSEQTSSSGAG